MLSGFPGPCVISKKLIFAKGRTSLPSPPSLWSRCAAEMEHFVPMNLAVLGVFFVPSDLGIIYFPCSWAVPSGLAGNWLLWSSWVKLRERGGTDLLEDMGKAPCLYEGLVVKRSHWMQRQNCPLKCGDFNG